MIQCITNAGMAELADAPDLGSGVNSCRFDSCYPHHKEAIILIRKISVLWFFYCKNRDVLPFFIDFIAKMKAFRDCFVIASLFRLVFGCFLYIFHKIVCFQLTTCLPDFWAFYWIFHGFFSIISKIPFLCFLRRKFWGLTILFVSPRSISESQFVN